MARTVFAYQKIQGPRQLPVAGEAFQFRTEIVRRPGTGKSGKFFVRGHHVAGEKIARRIGAPIEINGCQHGFEGVYEQALFTAAASRFLASAQLQITAQIEPMRGCEKMRGADQVILDQRELAFREIPETGEQPFADQPTENRIAQEFEAFVVGRG